MNSVNKKPNLALPVQAPPVWRNESSSTAAQNTHHGAQAAMRCSDKTGMQLQMCLANQGIYV